LVGIGKQSKIKRKDVGVNTQNGSVYQTPSRPQQVKHHQQ